MNELNVSAGKIRKHVRPYADDMAVIFFMKCFSLLFLSFFVNKILRIYAQKCMKNVFAIQMNHSRRMKKGCNIMNGTSSSSRCFQAYMGLYEMTI